MTGTCAYSDYKRIRLPDIPIKLDEKEMRDNENVIHEHSAVQ